MSSSHVTSGMINISDVEQCSTASSASSKPSEFFENQLLSYKQAARYLSVSEPYLRRLKSKGLVPFVLVGNRAVRFRVSSLNRWIEKREVT
jgi:excisionase family DNA binding protein